MKTISSRWVALLTLTVFFAGALLPAQTEAEVENSLALPAVTDSDERWGFNAIAPDAISQKLARDAGARWTRAELRWDKLEGVRGVEQWGDFDRLVDSMQRADISIQGILIGTPDWGKDAQARSLPLGIYQPYDSSQNLWTRYVKSVVQRYKGKIKYWEVWNEPDYAEIFWAGTTADYYQMLKVTYQTIKAVDPTAKVLMAGLAYYSNPGFLDELTHIMMADPTGRANNYYFDILPWHTYSGPNGVLDRVAESQRLLTATVGMKPIWINEANVPPWDESPINNFKPFDLAASSAEQPSYVIQTFANAVAAGVEKVFIYRLKDDPSEDQAWGFVRSNGTLRPAYVAYQVATRYLSHATSGRVATQGSLQQVITRRPGERVSVVWNRDGSTLRARVGAMATSATIIDSAGRTRSIQPVLGQYQLDLDPATSRGSSDATDFMIGGPPLFIQESVRADLQVAEETSALIRFAGAWAPDTTVPLAVSTAKRSSTAGANASIAFDGPSVTWMTSKGPDRGIARVEVDGNVLGEIDLFSPTEVKEVPLTFGDFSQGSHRITVTATGRRVGSAVGAYVDIDAFLSSSLQAGQAGPDPTRPPSTPAGAIPTGARPQAAMYSAVVTPSTSVSLPIITKANAGMSTPITITNTGDDAATGTVRFLDAGGREVATAPFSLDTVASTIVDPRRVDGLPAGFLGSADLSSTQPIAVSVTEARDGADAMSYSPVADAGSRAYIPLVFKTFNGWETTLYVSNQDATPVTVGITYYRSNGPGGPWTVPATIPARSSIALSGSATPVLPADFVGSATVMAADGSHIAAVVTSLHSSGSGSSYESVSAGTTQIDAPLLYKESSGWSTGLQVQNVGTQPAQVTVTYTAIAQGQWREQTTIPAGGSTTFYQPSNGQLPSGFIGSAVVVSTNGQPLVGLVNGVQAARSMATAYVTPTNGSSMIWASNLARNADGWTTNVQVQNASSDPTTITLLLQDPSGVLVGTFTETNVPAGASRLFVLPLLAGVPDGWQGSGTIVSSGGPLVAIVNESRY